MIAALLLIAASLDPLLARIVDAYGGAERLAKVHAVRQTGTLDSPRGPARVLRAFTGEDQLRVEIQRGESKPETRVLDGASAYNSGEEVRGPAHDAMVLQHARLDLPNLLLRNRKALVELGPLERSGRKLVGIGVPLRGGLSVAIGVDPATGRIVHSEGALKNGMRFATDYSDFRPVDGVLFAFAEETSVNGSPTGTTKLSRIELLPSLPATTFRPHPETF